MRSNQLHIYFCHRFLESFRIRKKVKITSVLSTIWEKLKFLNFQKGQKSVFLWETFFPMRQGILFIASTDAYLGATHLLLLEICWSQRKKLRKTTIKIYPFQKKREKFESREKRITVTVAISLKMRKKTKSAKTTKYSKIGNTSQKVQNPKNQRSMSHQILTSGSSSRLSHISMLPSAQKWSN
jgi:hypothetical protein